MEGGLNPIVGGGCNTTHLLPCTFANFILKRKTKKKENTYFKNYDLYSDANPKDTIRIKYKTLEDVKSTIKKLEKIYKNGTKPHTRISKITNKTKGSKLVQIPKEKH